MSSPEEHDDPELSITVVPPKPAGYRRTTERLHLVVIADGRFVSHVLPDSATISIGRHRANAVPIDDPSVSRRHALLRIQGELTIEDAGSANGTFVRGDRLKPHVAAHIALWEVVTLGEVDILVQRRSAAVRHRRVWTHEYFEARLEEECARAARSSSHFAVLHLRNDSTRSDAELRTILDDALRQADVIAAYGPQEYEILLTGADARIAEEVRARLSQELGPDIQIQVRRYPEDGRTADALASRSANTSRASEGSDELVVVAPATRGLFHLMRRVASSSINVLILGETGVGKEVLARELHRRSSRSPEAFVAINCAALTEALLESELFGHEKGSFTGAHHAKAGLLESADGGTVLLDEVGELPPAIQAKLLRVVEDRQVRRLGGLKSMKVDVRIIAATNRDLEGEVAKGTFRADLFYRLSGITMVIPPLRERSVEIEPLARRFLSRLSASESRIAPDIAPEALSLLKRYAWPGNIRELKNVIERAALLAGDGSIQPEHLPVEKMRATFATSRAQPSDEPNDSWIPPRPRGRGPVEREWILAALERAHGNQTRAAALLGISRRTLISRLEEYGVPRPRKAAKEGS
jgi:DNA-binding NtrC family response regulator